MPIRKKDDSRADLEELLIDSITAQAMEKVWTRFERALQRMDVHTRSLLIQYFNGTSLKAMSQATNIEVPKLRQWLDRKKHELIQLMKEDISVKQ